MNEAETRFETLRLEKYPRDITITLMRRPRVRALIWDKTDGRCWYCGTKMNPFTDFCIDHVCARSHGGQDTYSNLVPCCRRCNAIKADFADAERLRTHLAVDTPGTQPFTKEQIAYLRNCGADMDTLLGVKYEFYYQRKQREDVEAQEHAAK
jgi:hypothetical protein